MRTCGDGGTRLAFVANGKLLALMLTACVPTEQEREFERVMALSDVPRVMAINQMSLDDRIELYLYEMRVGRPARLVIMTDLVNSEPSIVPVLVKRLKAAGEDDVYALLFFANHALCIDDLLSIRADTHRRRELREAVLNTVSKVSRKDHLWAADAAAAARGECAPIR